MRHLLVTNDFPPKVGGIQSYLWELWRRLPPDRFVVLAPRQAGHRDFDAAQPFRVVRAPEPVLLPVPGLARRIDRLADETGAGLVVLDPALPLGLVGPRLRRPYALVLHGAEVSVPARLPMASAALRRVVAGASLLVAAGSYPAAEAERLTGAATPPVTVVPPGVDCARFRPLRAAERMAARSSFGVPAGAPLVVSVSRLVPRKGMDVLVDAAARLAPRFPDLVVAIAGTGRDRRRLERRIARTGAPVRLLGQVGLDHLPALYGCADVFAMLCRNRWAGLEQEGFGIVFLEAAACAVPSVAGRSGGVPDAVLHGETGLVVDHPRRADDVAGALARLLRDAAGRDRMGAAARRRVEAELAYDVLAGRLELALAAAVP